MEETSTAFLIDANSLISPYRGYYPFDLAPKFWKDFEIKITDGSIVILDKVYDELYAGGDELSEWLSNIDPSTRETHKTPEIISKYGEILAYIQTSGFYTQKALAEWSGNRLADPWIVACATVKSLTVVTFEAANVNLNKQFPSSHPKIPDLCKVFEVAYMNLFDMMRALVDLPPNNF